jgi:hypothetical protein
MWFVHIITRTKPIKRMAPTIHGYTGFSTENLVNPTKELTDPAKEVLDRHEEIMDQG